MIISSLLTLIYNVLNFLLIFSIPSLPATITTILGQVTDYLVLGLQIIRTFIGATAFSVLGVCLMLVIAANAAYMVYSLVMWVLAKIPFLGVK